MLLHKKIALTIIGFTIVVSVTMLMFIMGYVTQSLQKTLENKGKGLAQLSLREIESYLLTMDYPLAKKRLLDIGRSDNEVAFLYVRVPSQDGLILHTFDDGMPAALLVDPQFDDRNRYIELIKTKETNVLAVYEKFFIRNEGVICVGLKTDRIAALQKKVFVTFCGGLLAMVAGAVLLSVLITSPIRRLYRDAQLVHEGSASRITIPSGSTSEVAVVARAFDETLAKLERARKLTYLADLAASISHEISNPVGIIHMKAEILKEQLAKHEPWDNMKTNVEKIAAHSERVLNVVKRVLSFGGKSAREKSTLDLREEVNEAVSLVQELVKPHNVEIVLSLPDAPILMHANKNEIQQVLMNLLLNARDAIVSGGKPGIIAIGVGRSDGICVVTVKDNGTGIDKTTMLKMFEPFFTTKAAGDGTGLGLTVCEKIVKDYGGEIKVESEPGLGSTFTVLFPASKNGGS